MAEAMDTIISDGGVDPPPPDPGRRLVRYKESPVESRNTLRINCCDYGRMT